MAQRGELPSIHEKPSKSTLRNGADSRYQDIYVNWKTIRRELGKSDNMSPQKIRLVPSKRFYDVVTKTTSLSNTDAVSISEPFLSSRQTGGSTRSYVDWRRLIKHTLQLFQQNWPSLRVAMIRFSVSGYVDTTKHQGGHDWRTGYRMMFLVSIVVQLSDGWSWFWQRKISFVGDVIK